MILVLDRSTGEISNGDITARGDPTGNVIVPWCKAADAAGLDLNGMRLEVHDTGCQLGDRRRDEGMLCFTIPNAGHVLNPPKSDKPRGRARKS